MILDNELQRAKRPAITGVNIFFMIFVFIFLIFQVVLIVIVMALSFIYGENYYTSFFDNNIYFITLITEYGLILIPVLIYAAIKKLDFREVFRIKKLPFLPAVIIFFISFPAYFTALMLNTIVIYLIQFFGEIPRTPIPVAENIPQLLLGIFVIAVTPAICEEIMHRGLLLNAYERRGALRAVFITSFFFGIFHFDITNFLGPVFLGLIIGFFVIRTNSIFAGILAHFLNNTIAQLLSFFMNKMPLEFSESTVITPQDLFIIIITGIISLIIVSILIYLFKLSTEGKNNQNPPISSVKDDFISVATHWPVIVVSAIYIIMAAVLLFSIN